MVVAGDDLGSRFIGHRRGDFVERGAQQVGHDLLDLASREQRDERVQA